MNEIKTFEDYQKAYKQSIEDPAGFWGTVAEQFTWRKKWDKVFHWESDLTKVEWFIGGKLNITENCLDRHLESRGDQIAYIWEPNDPSESSISITYNEVFQNVCRLANVLKRHHIGKGDKVCIYMPMIPELVYAVLACARIGAVHSVVFAGFSAASLSSRINDASCKMVLTADGVHRGPKLIDLKEIVDQALEDSPSVHSVITVNRTGNAVEMKPERDFWYHKEIMKVGDHCEAEVMDSEDMLFILYTSGSTGKPKGMVHTCGGYMVYTNYTFRNVFQYQEGDVYWCTADVGWITGHSYIVYAPLSAGATSVIFEGIPSYPDMGRFWEVVEKYNVNIFYTAPTAIRALEKADLSYVTKHDLSSLKVLGTVGEPINEEAWHWYNNNIGKGNCPIVDTWWQTETGGFMISPLAGITQLKPSFATLPLPGIQVALMDKEGQKIIEHEKEGSLVITHPWPSMARTIYGDHQRFYETYFKAFDRCYFTGDGAKRDRDGFYRITGRVDDVIIVSGHNLGTAEIESAIDEHEQVVESAVVGFPHDVKGFGVYAYVICHNPPKDEDQLRTEIIKLVSEQIGHIAKPEKIQFVTGLPKTRSGKIMRRILRKIAAGDTDNLGDTSTLLDPEVVEDIKSSAIR